MKKEFDYRLLIAVIFLALFGLVMIYSASNVIAEYKYLDSLKFVKNQGLFLILGIVGIYILSKIDYTFYKSYSNLILLVSFILLVLVIIPGVGVVRNGSRSWFAIGPFGVQPSELAKISLIIFTSKYLSNNDKSVKSFIHGSLPIFLVIGLFFLLIMLEPDFGTGMVLVLTLVAIIFISGVPVSLFLKLGLFGLLGVIGLVIAAPYRLERITSFLNPWSDPLGSGFQIIQSLYAIGPGGLLGQGFLNSRQKNFYLPEPQTDFIFSIISEEFGFLGVIIVVSLFFYIYYRCIKIAIRQTDLFAKYLVFGLSNGLLIQAILNLSVVIGLIPVTGVTLPFLSYGGSSLLISMASIGIILRVSKQ